jgi:ribosomal protein S6E (S10)
MSETVFKSMHGRELGMNSSGQLVGQRDKTDTTLYPISSIKKVQAAVATGSTAENAGMQILSSGTATAQSYEIKAPVPGVDVQLHVQSSASEVTIGGTATGVIFKPALAGAGSSMFLSAANLSGKVLKLTGVTTTQYAVTGSTLALTIG